MPHSIDALIRKYGPLSLIGAGLALLIGTILISLRPSTLFATATVPSPDSAEDTFPEIRRVSLAEARAAFDTQAAVFVDVRDPDSFAASHIPGALSIPLAELDERLNELDRSEWIITYCT